jgi:hypothetical protein
MTPGVLVALVLVILMARGLADLHLGGHYTCPSCGAKGEGRHSPDCPWSRPQ